MLHLELEPLPPPCLFLTVLLPVSLSVSVDCSWQRDDTGLLTGGNFSKRLGIVIIVVLFMRYRRKSKAKAEAAAQQQNLEAGYPIQGVGQPGGPQAYPQGYPQGQPYPPQQFDPNAQFTQAPPVRHEILFGKCSCDGECSLEFHP